MVESTVHTMTKNPRDRIRPREDGKLVLVVGILQCQWTWKKTALVRNIKTESEMQLLRLLGAKV